MRQSSLRQSLRGRIEGGFGFCYLTSTPDTLSFPAKIEIRMDVISLPLFGRKYYVELSEKGKKIAVFQHLTLKRMVKKIVVELTETELEIFISLLNKIIKE